MAQRNVYRVDQQRWAHLREINGHEEQAVASTSTADAINLLEQLLDDGHHGALQATEVSDLTAWQRDSLLANLYTQIYGSKIDATITCDQCNEAYDLDFSITDLLESLTPNYETLEVEPLDDGFFTFPSGVKFRLPTGHDECQVLGLPTDQAEIILLQRCADNFEELSDDAIQHIQMVMEKLSPIVEMDMSASCPECSYEQFVHFDLQRYLLTALRNDRQQLMRDIHTLASTYGWSLTEILNLARSQRRSLVAMVEAEDSLQTVRSL